METARDTMCAECCKWTHRLTSGGNGIIFCDHYCAVRYDRRNGTHYAFNQYHYLQLHGQIVFNVDDVDIAWQSLLYWDRDCEDIDAVKRKYGVVDREGRSGIVFEKIAY